MSVVCKWLGFYLCMRETPPATETYLLTDKCDVLVVLKEDCKTERSGGLAFEVILKPATSSSPLTAKPGAPVRELSLECIDKKLKEANDRRASLEASKLLTLLKDKERCQEANQRVQELNDSFSRDVEKKLALKMELTAEKKNMQIKALQDRLREHAQKVEAVRTVGEMYRSELKEQIERKLETAGEKREAQLTSLQERIRKHEQHIAEVIEASNKFSKDTEMKLILKMEASLRNREEQLNQLMERLRLHEQRVQQVRQNKLSQSMSNSSISESTSFENIDNVDDLSMELEVAAVDGSSS